MFQDRRSALLVAAKISAAAFAALSIGCIVHRTQENAKPAAEAPRSTKPGDPYIGDSKSAPITIPQQKADDPYIRSSKSGRVSIPKKRDPYISSSKFGAIEIPEPGQK